MSRQMRTPALIGMSGYATAGKDAAAQVLLDSGYRLAGFSDGIGAVARVINPALHGTVRLAEYVQQVGWDRAEQYREVAYLLKNTREAVTLPVLRDGRIVDEAGVRTLLLAANPYIDGHLRIATVADSLGWTEAKRLTEVRGLLQRIGGPEGGRKVFGQSVWIDTVLAAADGHPTVVTGVRFVDELRAIEDNGGLVIRVSRPGVGPANTHATETSLDDHVFAWRLTNDSTLEVLRERLARLVYDRQMDETAAGRVAAGLSDRQIALRETLPLAA